MNWVIAIAVVTAIIYIPLFIYNYFRAPDRIDLEKSLELERLKLERLKLDDPDK